ncbi:MULTISPECIES: glycoside hydrolase family 2 TIM barrel-domain containing protein [unclassified Actinomyces]|uniref:glycoside hydrolase family 2 protein n=1 Tax=unclassified Actinomyces TaxID=2609248 RepID=UPI00201805E8|nr:MULTISPECIES: glycoside hydrolase family 2 TIM barrel-domain containing protein [unclassified Actinomyces]MCL3777479.1 glycoside hydrolase family 2 [Actinomyces sp. AC-20-1]MCL3788919.1 glycoside hydrolase family 2 [Actinomyces sp. 187325]MCL3791555.1 glycoside hydrolase family 2 [Actinomyces sp. 186855]MCL3794192.1 glycoside hydrolase family 2 [Actinomyces sp. 217892]
MHAQHPDPMRERAQVVLLDGWWEHVVLPGADLDRRDLPEDGWEPVRVPFAIETRDSGVERALQPDETLVYRRRLEVPDAWAGRRLRVVLGAVDHSCQVRVGGRVVAEHVGGYLPVEAVLAPDAVAAAGPEGLELTVLVTDPTDTASIQRGKQVLTPRTIWYTATSGIWGTTWMEPLPEVAVTGLRVEPLPGLDGFRVRVDTDAAEPADCELSLVAPDGGQTVTTVRTGTWTRLPVERPQLWSPGSPALYRVRVRVGEDEVSSWAGLRTVGLTPGRGSGRRRRVLLNGEPVLVNAPLSQGYWPSSGMTPPDEDAVEHDLRVLKEMGFNAVRVHIKVESRRFYHLCDRLGLMVVQDMVSGGRPPLGIQASGVVQALGYTVPDGSRLFRQWTGRGRAVDRAQFARELAAMVRHLRCHPSVIMWVPFNEGWGQFDSRRAEAAVRRLDPTRLVDAVSGWFDQGRGDLRSRHRYVLRLRRAPRHDHRPFYLSEFGGLNLAVPGHVWDGEGLDVQFGYGFSSDAEELAEAMTSLYRDQLIPLAAHGLAACTYTQVSDVERETNGLMTYDREVTKVEPSLMARLNGELEEAFRGALPA